MISGRDWSAYHSHHRLLRKYVPVLAEGHKGGVGSVSGTTWSQSGVVFSISMSWHWQPETDIDRLPAISRSTSTHVFLRKMTTEGKEYISGDYSLVNSTIDKTRSMGLQRVHSMDNSYATRKDSSVSKDEET